MSFRLLHTADLHLEAPFVGAGLVPPPLAHRLARAGVDTLDRLVELALDQRVDALVVAGGLLPPAPEAATLRRVRAALDALAAGGVATVVAGHPGEPLERLSTDPFGPLPESVTLAEPGRITVVPVQDSDGQVVVEVRASSGIDGLARLTEAPFPADGPPRVAVCPLPPPRPDEPAPPALDRAPVAYWALGGRWPATLARLDANGAWVAMAGTPQLHGFGEPTVVAGAVLAEGEPGSSTLRGAPTWTAVAAVDPITVTVALAEHSDLDELGEGLRRVGRDLATARPGRLLVVRAVIEGVGAARLALVDPAVRAWLLEALRRAADEERPEESNAASTTGSRGGRTWWADLVLAPLPSPAADPLIRTDRLAAAAVRIGGIARGAEPQDVLGRARAVVGLGPGGGPPPGPAWAGLVRESTSVVLDLVGGERPCE